MAEDDGLNQKTVGWLPRQTGGPALSKRHYRARSRELRLALLEAQNALRASDRAAVVVVAGVDGAGKGETVNLITQWLDPRWIATRAFDGGTDEENERPPFWRYWRSLPPYGFLTLYLSAWYSRPLLRRVGGASREWLDTQLEEVRRFEQTLAMEGTAVLKVWLHLDRAVQAERLQEMSRDETRSWRVTATDWENLSHYDEFVEATEEILDATHRSHAPWVVIDGSDPRRRALDVGEALLSVLPREAGAETTALPQRAWVETVDLDDDEDPSPDASLESVSKAAYHKEIDRLRVRLGTLHRTARERGIPLVCVFEGRDAAGKGGAIRRLVPSFDVRRVDVVRIGAPTDEERAHHYLWRFWRRVPRAGYITIFDRSWYGRVLVERVEGLIEPAHWQRAYEEINDFERQLVDHGTVLSKFWLDIDRDEQEHRFEERLRLVHKRWKLTDEDLRNRERWDDYSEAVTDMFARTQNAAPWTLVSANDKRTARLAVLEEVARALEARLEDAD